MVNRAVRTDGRKSATHKHGVHQGAGLRARQRQPPCPGPPGMDGLQTEQTVPFGERLFAAPVSCLWG
jgi:hypothetical protein